MTVSIYPSTLPQPSALSVAAMERRLMSSINSGLPQVRPLQFDYVGYETMEFEFAADQIAIFDNWWTNDLVFGGRWFTATWLHTNGLAAICRFNAPTYSLMGYGKWKASIKTEIQGVYGSTAFDREPGGARDYDLLWTTYATKDNPVGENIYAAPFLLALESETKGGWLLDLLTHNLGTAVPAGAVVDFTATSVFTDPSDPNNSVWPVPAPVHHSSTTNRRWRWYSPSFGYKLPGDSGYNPAHDPPRDSFGDYDLGIYAMPGGYARYYAGITTTIEILIDGVPLPAEMKFSTVPTIYLGYPRFLLTCNVIYD